MLATALRGLVIGLTALAFAAPAHAEMSVLDNDQLRVGVDLEQGGALTWLSRSRGEHVPNLLSVAEQSYWGGPFLADGTPLWHGYQNPAEVVSHSNNGRTVYDRAVWAGCECSLQTWFTLRGHAVVVRNRLTSFRSGAQPYPAAWQELPALYAAGPSRLVTYDGARPYTNGAMHDVTELAQFELFTPLHYDMLATEHWAALVGDDGVGIGLVEPDALHMVGVSGNGDCCPSAYLAGVRQEVLDANVVYDYTYTLVVGSLRQIRTYAYAHRPDPRPRYVFAHDRRHFFEENATDAGFPIAGALRVRLPQDDPQLVGPESEWPARSVPRLYIRGAWHTQQAVATLWWGRADVVSRSFSPDRVRPFHVIPDGQFRTYRLDLFRNPTYRGTIDGIRLDPVTLAEPGGWVDVTCISWKPCPVDRSAERRLATDHGLIPFLDRFDTLNTSFWSINGNSLGALTAVAGGSLTVDVAPDAQPLPGQDSIGAGVYSRCTLAGDFDAQVDYGLDAWPPDNGVNVNFGVGHRTLFRHNGPGGSDWLSSYFPPFASGFAPATATTGSLRLARTGDFVRGYYRNVNGDWLFLDGARITAAPLNVSLSIFTNRPLPGAKDVRVAFDDFRVTRGEIDCP